MTTDTDPTTTTTTTYLARRIDDVTGLDPRDPDHAPTFQILDTEPCTDCADLTATALLRAGWDNTERRLCVVCAGLVTD